MKPPKTIVKSVLIPEWGFLHHHAVRLYEAGWVFSCDVCGEIGLDQKSREGEEYLSDLDDDCFGIRENGQALCHGCRESGKRTETTTSNLNPPQPSKDSKACPFCTGRTSIPCKRCDGSGWIGCPACQAVGGALCTRCKGEGTIDEECRGCQGTGVRQDFFGQLFRHKCRDCKGRKKKTSSCLDCDGEGRHGDCAKCAGKGEADCPICSGKAELPCPECRGYGRPVP